MDYPVTGLHHITACSSGAQEDFDLFTQVVGQRLIKQTILFDGRYAHYHLYYANGKAEPGTVMTTFPYNRVKGRPGSGQIQATVYTVAKGTLTFWIDHLNWHRIVHRHIHERFGQKFVHFQHPCGLEIEIIDDWYTIGLRGTGSKTIVIDDVFVPEYRTLSNKDVEAGVGPIVRLDGARHLAPLHRGESRARRLVSVAVLRRGGAR